MPELGQAVLLSVSGSLLDLVLAPLLRLASPWEVGSGSRMYQGSRTPSELR